MGVWFFFYLSFCFPRVCLEKLGAWRTYYKYTDGHPREKRTHQKRGPGRTTTMKQAFSRAETEGGGYGGEEEEQDEEEEGEEKGEREGSHCVHTTIKLPRLLTFFGSTQTVTSSVVIHSRPTEPTGDHC